MVVRLLLFQVIGHRGIFFLAMCILDIFQHLVGADDGCVIYWYIRDINIPFTVEKELTKA
jgi:hypothetical protein